MHILCRLLDNDCVIMALSLMAELEEFQQHIDAEMAELESMIANYSLLGYNDKSAAYAQIRNKTDQISSDLTEMDSTSATWLPELRTQERAYTAKIRSEFANIQYKFNSEVSEENRRRLLGDSHIPTLDQNRAADTLIDDLNDTKEIGIGILQEMDRQRNTIVSISSNINALDTELDTGESLLNEMECRSRQRQYFLYGVVFFMFITVCVFVYYILK